MKICGLQKMSLLDYPGFAAATVFTGGCNLRCPFCHNAMLVIPDNFETVITEEEFFKFLEKRKGLLDGVCVTGGEPLLQPDIKEFLTKIRNLGFLVKLDTNGCFPKILSELISEKVVDYIAMDIKNSPEKYPLTTGIPSLNFSNIQESIHIIMNSHVEYEFRTTLVRQFHTAGDIEKISELIKGADKYFLQAFVDSGNLIGSAFNGFSLEETGEFVKILSANVKNTQIRGQ